MSLLFTCSTITRFSDKKINVELSPHMSSHIKTAVYISTTSSKTFSYSLTSIREKMDQAAPASCSHSHREQREGT